MHVLKVYTTISRKVVERFWEMWIKEVVWEKAWTPYYRINTVVINEKKWDYTPVISPCIFLFVVNTYRNSVVSCRWFADVQQAIFSTATSNITLTELLSTDILILIQNHLIIRWMMIWRYLGKSKFFGFPLLSERQGQSFPNWRPSDEEENRPI